MDIEKIKITDIIPAEYNPRQISDEELTKLSNSINEFGLVDPIIINLKNNKIIGGHQRYDVLINQYTLGNNFYAELNLLRFGDIGWVFTDTDLKIESKEHEKALNLALNKISGEWDFDKLSEVLEDLKISDFDITLTGFEDMELIEGYDDLVFFDDNFEENNQDENEQIYDLNEIKSIKSTFELHEGDEWKLLGNTLKIGELNGKRCTVTFNYDTMNITFEKLKESDETPLQDFMQDNQELESRFRKNVKYDK